MSYPKTTAETDFDPRRFWMTIAGICALIILGSVFITRSYTKRRQYEQENYRPPHLARLEADLEAINRDGTTVSLSQLKGKIWVMGYMYTDCPSGCLGLAAYLEELQKEVGDRDEFQLVSISLNPADDTPEKITAWVEEHGIDLPNWWFLTGDETKIREYMHEWFNMSYGEESDDPAVVAAQGQFQHEPMLVLVDDAANIRGYYRVMQTDGGEREFGRLKLDTALLLGDIKSADAALSNPGNEGGAAKLERDEDGEPPAPEVETESAPES